MTSYLFRDRPPTPAEVERLRLALSTYRDGSGQNVRKTGTYPGWRDFERVVAAVLNGQGPENKAVFDVEVPVDDGLPYGISCKMSKLDASGSAVLMELSNSHAYFWRRLEELGLDPATHPAEAGVALLELVAEWHAACAATIDVARSSYLVLTHDSAWVKWRLFWYDLDILEPRPHEMDWAHEGKRIYAVFESIRWWDWYGWSGGQLKYYPPIDRAKWASPEFELEPAPEETPADRARRYWPDRWPD